MKGMNCACGKVASYEEHLKFNKSDIDGWVFKECAETYYNPEKAEKILLLNELLPNINVGVSFWEEFDQKCPYLQP